MRKQRNKSDARADNPLMRTPVANVPPALVQADDMGTLYCGDCLDVLEHKIEPESVDLLYADPPFFSNRNYEVVWGDEAEVRSFEDRWEGGVEHYAGWMRERLRACHRVLKPTGSIYLHCDWHATHHLRLALDEIFGAENFRNELIWHYKFRMMLSERIFNRKHDTILFYGKTAKARVRMEAVTEPWTRDEIIRVRKQAIYKDDAGREWIWMPGGRGHSKNKKKYLDEIMREGKALDDVWDMPIISSSAKERMGYPTQKPERLLERIVKAGSDESDVVLDPFCGCGTTLAVAQRLDRKWIGIDISPTAIKVIKQRLARSGATGTEMVGLPTTLKQLHALKPFEFQNWVVRDRFNGTLGPKGGDKGIDGYSFLVHEPIQVKQSDGVGRNVVDNFKAAIQRAKKRAGWIVAFSFGKGAHEEAARVKREDGIDIRLVTVDDLLRKPPGAA